MILCPFCKKPLRFLDRDDSIRCIKRKYYKCKNCKKKYTRHTFTNDIGLIQFDNLYEEGFMKNWK